MDRATAPPPPGGQPPPGGPAPTSLLMWLGYRAAEDRIVAALEGAGFGDITRAQVRLLAGIDDDEGTRLVVLAERARIAKQTATALVDRLAAAGYVRRAQDPDDGRARLVQLTSRGREIVPVARAEEQRIEAEWQDRLGVARMRHLRAALEELRGLVDP
ncbi:MarR family winged helix-turn-helix transcriptional regulator [Rhodococcus sp. IEGM 1408]|uniref:MarR family winged helix-turn-helix transcriptional regulator n=1 Tax=Rhodococcus sp. IEGM 1408 TaxID=3082220 RepID=UPI002954E938|nr:MarR family transcriptional regulator [Rhodococcus sp. IEGM 1408]MDV8001537.1 MarR family transcriptional regulator [Rhodococcus sp. IEGM 1408]